VSPTILSPFKILQINNENKRIVGDLLKELPERSFRDLLFISRRFRRKK